MTSGRKNTTCCLMLTMTGWRNNSVHSQLFDQLSIVVHVVPRLLGRDVQFRHSTRNLRACSVAFFSLMLLTALCRYSNDPSRKLHKICLTGHGIGSVPESAVPAPATRLRGFMNHNVFVDSVVIAVDSYRLLHFLGKFVRRAVKVRCFARANAFSRDARTRFVTDVSRNQDCNQGLQSSPKET